MKNSLRIFIVEDDMIIAANVAMQLSKLGYDVLGIASRGEEALAHCKLNPPDLILMDINLKGKLDGIATVKAIQQFCDIPVIYLTANSDEGTFSNAKTTHPYAFISKPFNQIDLERTIALVAQQLTLRHEEERPVNYDLEVLNDRIFIRHNGKMVKLLLEDIHYIEADRNYCHILTSDNKYLLVSTLKTLEEELFGTRLMRVHRSFIVNLAKLDVVAESHLEIKRKVIPISKSYKDRLLSRIHTI
ncbi:response regulator [Muriicola sp. Z0-33]|uniref:response regulator n=1 Tax=Muriicola sp. Z0-33 TaxID=2816957 RepID=UPI002238D723|nr:response regulator [Muriicola sp. Z0-33]MCW5517008.1 response regulator [Muriicola sp. Z0-33]